MEQPKPELFLLQDSLRELERLTERLRTGQRMLKDAIQQNQMAQATKIVEHFVQLNEVLLSKADEMMLLQQFTALGIKGHIRRDGRYVSLDSIVLEKTHVPLDPKTLIVLERLKNVFGEIPHDILTIED